MTHTVCHRAFALITHWDTHWEIADFPLITAWHETPRSSARLCSPRLTVDDATALTIAGNARWEFKAHPQNLVLPSVPTRGDQTIVRSKEPCDGDREGIRVGGDLVMCCSRCLATRASWKPATFVSKRRGEPESNPTHPQPTPSFCPWH